MAEIVSIQVGQVITEGDPETRDALTRRWTTGFYKHPVDGPVSVLPDTLDGDAVADTKHHGGVDKAILAYAACHYPAWREEYDRTDMQPGAFGENLTIAGQDESSVCIGDRYRLGDVVLEVSQPRQPCWKLARRWGLKSLVKRVTQTGRSGWYLRVIETGTIAAGMELERLSRPHPEWTIARADDVLYGREVDRAATVELMQIKELSAAWKEDLL